MEAIGIFMFAIAIAIVVTYIASILFLNKKNSMFLSYPTRQDFNIAWGLAFYMLYGMIVAETKMARIIFVIAISFVFMRIIFLYMMRRYLDNKNTILIDEMISKIITKKIIKQKEYDEKTNKQYSPKDAMKLLGLTANQLKNNEYIEKQYSLLSNNSKIKSPYFYTMLEKAKETIPN